MQELDLKTLSPETAEEASTILREAWETHAIVNIWGGGTKQDLGNIGKPAQLVLSTLKLDKLVDYEPADLTITVQAGMKWATLRETLEEKGQWLPLDPPELEGATVGGVVASNVSGPKRLLYGTLRDLVIGCQFVLADGTIGRSGGRVVKNVSGYDLHKLLIGSLGTLALITELTFKVLPKPGYSEWLIATFISDTAQPISGITNGFEAARKLVRSNLSPAALELLEESVTDIPSLSVQTLYISADGVEVAVKKQIEGMLALCQSQGAQNISKIEDTEASKAVWLKLCNIPLSRPTYNMRLRFSSLLTNSPALWVKGLHQIVHGLLIDTTLQARAGTGLVYQTGELPEKKIGSAARLIERARNQVEAEGGSLVIEKAPLALKEKLDAWGKPAGLNSLSAMQTIKQQLDERNLLNPGKFVGGI